MKKQTSTWVMPEWMEKFRDQIVNTGGNPIEELMSDNTSTFQNNLPRTTLILCVESQISILIRLHNMGVL